MQVEAQAHKIQILMAEDNPVDAKLLRLAFNEVADWPVELTVVEDGEKAIQILREKGGDEGTVPDLIILDLNLPRRDGTEVLHAIRSSDRLSRLPVAVLSSSPRDVIQYKLTTAGVMADGHFTKPLEFLDFINLGTVLRSWYLEHSTRRAGSTSSN
jgi:two-component system, chemotaxis family, response regulator Rcp1